MTQTVQERMKLVTTTTIRHRVMLSTMMMIVKANVSESPNVAVVLAVMSLDAVRT